MASQGDIPVEAKEDVSMAEAPDGAALKAPEAEPAAATEPMDKAEGAGQALTVWRGRRLA
eukprot:gene22066-26587_t